MALYDEARIDTPRLLLRPPVLADLDAWAAMMSDEETARYIGGVTSRAATWRSMMTTIGSWHALGFAMFSVIEKSTGRWIGRLGPWRPEGWPGTEIGWSLVRDAWGKGYATEGATAATDWAVDRLGWTDIIHSIDPRNTASQNVAKRLGSHNRGRGTLPDPYQDAVVDIWGQSSAEWRARRAAR